MIIWKQCPICHGTVCGELGRAELCHLWHIDWRTLIAGNFVENDGVFSNFRLMSQSQSQRTPNIADSNSEDGRFGGIIEIRHRAKKRRHAKLQKREVSYHVYFSSYAVCAWKASRHFGIQGGVTKKVRDTVFEYWYKYVRMCIQSKWTSKTFFLP